MTNNTKGKSGLATAGMVLGIIAVPGAWIPFLNIISIILGVLAFIFGIIPLVKKKSVGKAVAAVVLGACAVIVGIYMMTVATNAVNDAVKKNDKASQQTSAENKQKLTLDEGWSIDKSSNPYATKVIGTVSNNSDKPINGYIQITFSALDASGANVGDCLANANTVDANGKWKFEALCSGNNIETVRFKDITGF